VIARNLVALTCQEVVELATEYLSQAMEPEDRVRFEQHLLTCPPCTAYLGQVTATVELASGLREAAPSGDPEKALIGLFRRWKQR
jgi:predicted anti-sigma-YlaC factor YlaD